MFYEVEAYSTLPKGTKPLTREELVARMQAITEAAVVEALQDFTPQDIVRQIQEDMAKSRAEITLKVLGLDNRWGRWEVDHCNGRMSALTGLLSTQLTHELETMVRELADEVFATEGPKIRAALKKAVTVELAETTRRAGHRQLRDMAETYVARIAKEVFNEATCRDPESA